MPTASTCRVSCNPLCLMVENSKTWTKTLFPRPEALNLACPVLEIERSETCRSKNSESPRTGFKLARCRSRGPTVNRFRGVPLRSDGPGIPCSSPCGVFPASGAQLANDGSLRQELKKRVFVSFLSHRGCRFSRFELKGNLADSVGTKNGRSGPEMDYTTFISRKLSLLGLSCGWGARSGEGGWPTSFDLQARGFWERVCSYPVKKTTKVPKEP